MGKERLLGTHRKKRGQAPVPVSWLIGIIALFIMIYIILLPEGDKQALINDPGSLGQSTPSYPGIEPNIRGNTFRILLSETPGIVYPLTNQIIDKPLASINLFSISDTRTEGLASRILVKSSSFSDTTKDLRFTIRDIQHLESAALLFLAKEQQGNLIIQLNGEEIFTGEVSSDDLPLQLPRTLLRQTNTLTFSVDSPGINIFTTNLYDLKDIQLITKSKIQNNREVRTFVLNTKERGSLQRLALFYFVNCFTRNEDGRLTVVLNGRVIQEGLVVCDAGQVAIDIQDIDVVEGRNVLEFLIDKGKYTLEQVVIQQETGHQQAQKFFFTLQIEDINRLIAGGFVNLELKFLRDGLRKTGTIFINGVPIYIDTYDDFFGYNITPYITEGINIIRIVPDIPLDIVSMDVILI